MNKTDTIQWIVENKLADNEFAAKHIWEGLTLWKFDDETKKAMVEKYRKFRRATKDSSKTCYQYVLDGKEPPKEFNDILNGVENEEI